MGLDRFCPTHGARILEKMCCMSRYLCYITFMARGDSGRIVIEIEPEAKKQLYSALALAGSTLKDWFLKRASDFCADAVQPSLFSLPPRLAPKILAKQNRSSRETPGRRNRQRVKESPPE